MRVTVPAVTTITCDHCGEPVERQNAARPAVGAGAVLELKQPEWDRAPWDGDITIATFDVCTACLPLLGAFLNLNKKDGSQ